jgi:hypothetical protein
VCGGCASQGLRKLRKGYINDVQEWKEKRTKIRQGQYTWGLGKVKYERARAILTCGKSAKNINMARFEYL